MKKYLKIIIGIFVVIAILSGISLYERIFKKTPENIINKFKIIDVYSCDVEYEVFNKRTNKVEIAKVNAEGKGKVTLTFNDGRQMVYSNNNIILSNNLTDEKYELSNDFDKFYCLAFIEKIRQEFLSNGDEIEINYHNGDNLGFIEIKYKIYDNNKEINNATVYIDSKTATPLEEIVYDEAGNITMRIKYSNFIVNKKIK